MERGAKSQAKPGWGWHIRHVKDCVYVLTLVLLKISYLFYCIAKEMKLNLFLSLAKHFDGITIGVLFQLGRMVWQFTFPTQSKINC